MRDKGFTFVELLMVVAIILLLIAIKMPVLYQVREQGRRVVCLANVRDLATVALVYAFNNDDVLPIEVRYLPGEEGGDYVDPDWFRGDIFALFDLHVKKWKCPTRPILLDMDAPDHGSMHDAGIPNKATSYLYLGNGYGLPSNSYESDPHRRPHSATDAKACKNTLFADRVMYNDWLTEWEGTPWYINHHKRTDLSVPAGSNQAFADCHAEWVTEFPNPDKTNPPITKLDPSYPGNAALIFYPRETTPNVYWWW